MTNYDVEVCQLVPFYGEGYTKATLSLRLGPVIVRGAKIFEKEDKRWLSMPARKIRNGNWLDIVTFSDRQEKNKIENIVLEQYDNILNKLSQEGTDVSSIADV
ncbi:septation protein SpoVG family protein [bacterium]|nr:septation protein SpoVG family protein [bacterium]